MYVYVQPPGGKGSLTIKAANLQTLRKGIEDALHVPFADLVAVAPGGRLLPPKGSSDEALEEWMISRGSVISLSLRLCGGMPKKPKGGKAVAELDEKAAKLEETEKTKKWAREAKAALKARLDVEKKNSNMNRLKIQNQWRKIMRLAKVETLRKDIEILSQNHERDLDRKDAVIQMLDRDLEEAEEQFQMALRSHLDQVDRLIDFHDSRLLKMEQEFEKALGTLEMEFRSEKELLASRHQEQVAELSGIIATIDAYELEREAEAKQEHEQLREELRNRSLDAINVLRITLDSQIEDLEQHFETAHLNYLQNTDTRTTDFKNLTSKDQELSKEIEIKVRKIERYSAALKHWRIKIMQSSREHTERNQLLLAEKQSIMNHFQKLKGRMSKFREEQHRRLLDLTQNANGAVDNLKGKIELGSRILQLAELSRKSETEQEKVLAFQATPSEEAFEVELSEVIHEQQEKMKRREGESEMEPSAMQASAWSVKTGKAVERWNHLNNFWKKHNKLLLDKLFLDKERGRLQKENATLKNIVKQYHNGVAVNDDVMKSVNPLLVINGRVNMNSARLPVNNHQSQTVVDANHMVATNRVNTKSMFA